MTNVYCIVNDARVIPQFYDGAAGIMYLDYSASSRCQFVRIPYHFGSELIALFI
jgi:hypothetical protein